MHWQERRQGGQCCLGLTVLPFITKADPHFRCQAGDELWTRWSIFSCSCCDWPGLRCSGVHTSAVSSGLWQWQEGRRRWARAVNQPALKPSQREQHLPGHSCASRAIHLSSVLHMHSFTLSKYNLTDNIHPHNISSFSQALWHWGFVLDWKCHHLLLWVGAALWQCLIQGVCPCGCRKHQISCVHPACAVSGCQPWALGSCSWSRPTEGTWGWAQDGYRPLAQSQPLTMICPV